MTALDALPAVAAPAEADSHLLADDQPQIEWAQPSRRDEPAGRNALRAGGELAEASRHERPETTASQPGRAACKLRALALVLVAGALFGASPVIGRVSAGIGLPPLGLVFWSNVLAATVCLSVTFIRSGPPRLSTADMRFVLVWALVLGCLYQALTIVVAAHVEAPVIALVNSLRGFLVFLLAAALMMEAASLRRFLGLGLGFVAVGGLLMADASVEDTAPLWLSACLALPALLALHTLIMGSRHTSLDACAAVGAMMAVSSIVLLPVAWATDAIFLPRQALGAGALLILAFGLSTAAALVLAVVLVRSAGPVFAGQMAYSQTMGGLLWSFVILDERLTPLAWGALVLLLAGVWIVAPRPTPLARTRRRTRSLGIAPGRLPSER